MSAAVHEAWANVLAVKLYLATRTRPYLVGVLDDMSSAPADIAADLRALADVLDGGQVSGSAHETDPVGGDSVICPEPIPTYSGGVVVGHRWPDGSRVEYDDDGEPVDAR